ncbi:MAG: hypothetical protein JWR68_1260 [Polaromonas sp.]|nr:hypothetical protein [Polaromonas sp.]
MLNLNQANPLGSITSRFFCSSAWRRALVTVIGFGTGICAVPLYAQTQLRYTAVEYIKLSNPDATIVIRSMNTAGEVAGGIKTSSRKASAAQIFRSNGLEELAGDEGSGYSVAYGINDQGEVAGALNTSTALRPFRAVRKLGLQELALPPGTNGGVAYSINEQGEAAGYASGSIGIRPVWWTRSGSVQQLQNVGTQTGRALDLNDKGDVVGVSGDETKTAVFWPRKGSVVSLGTLPGYKHSEAVSISENGAIAGVATGVGDFPNRSHAVLWRPDTLSIQDLGVLPGGDDSRARDVNSRGEVVGTSNTPTGSRAFVWTAATGMLDLNGLINVPGLKMTDALSINKKGDIVVLGHDTHVAIPGAPEHDHAHEEHEVPPRILVLRPLQ